MQFIYLLLYFISIIVGFAYFYEINTLVIILFVLLNVMLSLRVIANIIQSNDYINQLKLIDERPPLFAYIALYGIHIFTIILMIVMITNMIKYESGCILAIQPLGLLGLVVIDKLTFTSIKSNSK